MHTPQTLVACAIACAVFGFAGTTCAQLVTEDLTGPLSATDLVNALVGPGVTVTNIHYSGANNAAGTFSGGTGIIGFANGIILSSGCVSNVVAVDGLNNSSSTTCDNNEPGDPDLDLLIPDYTTYDRSVLEFDFQCDNIQVISFQYVFSSEEYNEYANTAFNDVFGFFVNGVNVAAASRQRHAGVDQQRELRQPGLGSHAAQLQLLHQQQLPGTSGIPRHTVSMHHAATNGDGRHDCGAQRVRFGQPGRESHQTGDRGCGRSSAGFQCVHPHAELYLHASGDHRRVLPA